MWIYLYTLFAWGTDKVQHFFIHFKYFFLVDVNKIFLA